jgi:hypothetical protein
MGGGRIVCGVRADKLVLTECVMWVVDIENSKVLTGITNCTVGS